MENNLKAKILKFIIPIILIIVVALITNSFYKNKTKEYEEIDINSTNLEIEYNKEELLGNWDKYTGKVILDDSNVTIEGTGVSSSGNAIIINKAGTYYITGNITDGNISIKAGKDDEVQLVLDNCSITSKTTAPINGVQASKLTITLVDNSKNVITDNSYYSEWTDTENLEPDATIFTKTDLVINGRGKLIVNSNYSDGIVSKDGMKIINSEIDIISEDGGIKGKDYVAIKNANIKINSKGDGIKSNNSNDTTLGYIAIQGGTINIAAKADGIQAETILNISDNPEINITTTGENKFSESSKALKAGTEITIDTGTINIQSTDDSIHSNGIIVINNGIIKASSKDDGIHADTNIAINQANIDITESYEGIEGNYVEINGGIISIVSSDDGINIAGGNDNSEIQNIPGQDKLSFIEDANKKLIINGGSVSVNAAGDGLDSNGSIFINGGTVLVAGPEFTGNGCLDYVDSCVISGGDVVIYGSKGMWQNPSETSTQFSLTFRTKGISGDKIVLKDESGNEIKSFETVKSYEALTISNENIKKGETYTLYINGTTVDCIKVSDVVSSNFNRTINKKGKGPINKGWY